MRSSATSGFITVAQARDAATCTQRSSEQRAYSRRPRVRLDWPLTAAQQQHEICDDRINIQRHGLPLPTNFAYPYGGDEQNNLPAMFKQCATRPGARSEASPPPSDRPGALTRSPSRPPTRSSRARRPTSAGTRRWPRSRAT
jgi:hypothetical protein